MRLNITLIMKMLMPIKIICHLKDNSLDVNMIQSIDTSSDYVTSRRLEMTLPSRGISKSKRKKPFGLDLNLPLESQFINEYHSDSKSRRMNNCQEVEGSMHNKELEIPPFDHAQYPCSSDLIGDSGAPQKKNEDLRSRGRLMDAKYSIPTEGDLSTTSRNSYQQGVQPIPLINFVHLNKYGSSEIRHEGRNLNHKYYYKQSGAPVLIRDHKVRVIEGSWHKVPEIREMFYKMITHGRQIAFRTDLEDKIGDWFIKLQSDIAKNYGHVLMSKEESKMVSGVVSKAYHQVAFLFLGSLQVIHSKQEEEMVELAQDGWAFIVNYMEPWRTIALREEELPKVAVKPEFLEVENPFQLWSYLMGLSRTSRISLTFISALCNHWYHVSSYANKMKINRHQDFLEKWHHYLAKSNSLSAWEIEPLPTSLSSFSFHRGT
ncbi:hypothetical protein DFH28DRAFT_988294 [Melampsora americana]|nr:hypothetical protein DFH28DRAFT_988294 [Melampsora americana]